MADLMQGLLWVAAGSALGGLARYALSGFVARRIGETFPWGTLVVNVSGAFTIGILAGLIAGGGFAARPEVWLFAVAGFLGSYTTVSSFSLQTLMLARDGDFLRAGGNILLSLALCLAAVALGFLVGAPR